MLADCRFSMRGDRSPFPHANASIGIVALASGAGGVWLIARPPALALPPPCPGVAELAAAGLARLGPTLAVGAWMPAANLIIAGLAIAAFVALAAHVSRSRVAAAATGLAFAFLPAMRPRLVPFQGLETLIAVLTVAAFVRAARNDTPTARGWTMAGLVTTALLTPALALPLALLAGAFALRPARPGRRRPVWSGLAAGAGLLLAAVGVVLLMPGLPSQPSALPCLVPAHFGSAGVASPLREWVSAAGPYAAGLAVLGAFVARAGATRARNWHLLAYVLAPLVAGTWTSGGGASAPVLVGLWLLPAIGLAELIGGQRRVVGRVGVLTFAILLPALHLVPDRAREAPAMSLLGHDCLTLDGFERILAAVPDGGTLVTEDAVTDLYLRAARPHPGRLTVVPRDLLALNQRAATTGRILFALPWSQATLPLAGFTLVDPASGPMAGLKQARAVGACRVATSDWRDLADVTGSASLGVVAPGPTDRGPAVLYAESDRPFVAHPVDWSPATERGFFATVYDRTVAADARRLAGDEIDDAVPAEHRPDAAPYVLRLEVWRIPAAPLALRVALGAPAARVVAHARPGADGRLFVCPAPVSATSAFRPAVSR